MLQYISLALSTVNTGLHAAFFLGKMKAVKVREGGLVVRMFVFD